MFKSQCKNIDPATVVLCGLAGIGLLRALSVTSGALRFLWRKHLRPGKKLSDYGEWALVTGASDGIGRAYCNYLARQGTSSRQHDRRDVNYVVPSVLEQMIASVQLY